MMPLSIAVLYCHCPSDQRSMQTQTSQHVRRREGQNTIKLDRKHAYEVNTKKSRFTPP
jgi:hypothetical protein